MIFSKISKFLSYKFAKGLYPLLHVEELNQNGPIPVLKQEEPLSTV